MKTTQRQNSPQRAPVLSAGEIHASALCPPVAGSAPLPTSLPPALGFRALLSSFPVVSLDESLPKGVLSASDPPGLRPRALHVPKSHICERGI